VCKVCKVCTVTCLGDDDFGASAVVQAHVDEAGQAH